MATFQADGDAVLYTFGLLLDGNEFARGAAISVRHIPGGNVTYLDNGGLEAPRIKGRALLTSVADVIALQALQGSSGTLIYSEAPAGYAATLLSCVRTKSTGRAAGNFASVEFILDIP